MLRATTIRAWGLLAGLALVGAVCVAQRPPAAHAAPEAGDNVSVTVARQMAHPSVLPREFADLAEVVRRSRGEAKREALQSIEVLAWSMRDEDPDAAAAMTNYVAYRYLNDLEDVGGALRRFERVAAEGRSEPNVVDAARMAGQIRLWRLRNVRGAIEHYDRAIEVFENAPAQRVVHARMEYMLALMHSAGAHKMLGEHEEALALRERLLALPYVDLLPGDTARNQLIETARHLVALKRYEAAEARYERVLREHPAYAARNPESLWLRLEQIKGLGLEESEAAYIDRLEALWLSDEAKRFPAHRWRVGRRLVALARRAGDEDRHGRVLGELVTEMSARYDDVDPALAEQLSLPEVFSASLVEYGNLCRDAGRMEEAVRWWSEYVRRFPTFAMAEILERRIERWRAAAER